jgi:hypothetical protein
MRNKSGNMAPPFKWMTLTQAAERIGISPRQLTQRTEEGEIAYKREGRRGRGGVGQFLFAEADVDSYNARKRVPAKHEWVQNVERVPAVPTRIFINPEDCGSGLE